MAVLKRVPGLLAVGVAVAAAIYIPFATNPRVPVAKDVFSADGQRLVARAFVFGVALFLAHYAITVVVRAVVQGVLPSKIGAGPFSTEWTPEDAKQLREVDERLQTRIKEAIDLANDAISRITELERIDPARPPSASPPAAPGG